MPPARFNLAQRGRLREAERRQRGGPSQAALWRREAREAVAQGTIKQLGRDGSGDEVTMAQRRVHQGVLRRRRCSGHGRQLAAHPVVAACSVAAPGWLAAQQNRLHLSVPRGRVLGWRHLARPAGVHALLGDRHHDEARHGAVSEAPRRRLLTVRRAITKVGLRAACPTPGNQHHNPASSPATAGRTMGATRAHAHAPAAAATR